MTGRMLAWLLFLATLIWGTTVTYIFKVASAYGWLRNFPPEVSWSNVQTQ